METKSTIRDSSVSAQKGFTEDEYKRELELHHVKLEKGRTMKELYNRQGPEVKDNPKSGVFRDYKEYGVYPVRVFLNSFKLTVPFIVSRLTGSEISEEIVNQGIKNPVLKIKQFGIGKYVAPDDGVLFVELIKARISEKKLKPFRSGIQKYISASNFFLYNRLRRPEQIDGLLSSLKPSKEKIVEELLPMIPPEIMAEEIKHRSQQNPRRWYSEIPTSGTLSPDEAVRLLQELLVFGAYKSDMRQIIEQYNNMKRIEVSLELLDKVIQEQSKLISVVRIR